MRVGRGARLSMSIWAWLLLVPFLTLAWLMWISVLAVGVGVK
jgi:hypothetical protein